MANNYPVRARLQELANEVWDQELLQGATQSFPMVERELSSEEVPLFLAGAGLGTNKWNTRYGIVVLTQSRLLFVEAEITGSGKSHSFELAGLGPRRRETDRKGTEFLRIRVGDKNELSLGRNEKVKVNLEGFESLVDDAKKRSELARQLAADPPVSGAPSSVLPDELATALQQDLLPDEEVKVVIHGVSGSALIGTDRRLFVYKKGWMSGATFGQKLNSWDYRNIVGIQLEQGAITGYIAIQAPGVAAVDASYWSRGKGDPWKLPNAIAITKSETVRQGVSELRNLIAAFQQRSTAPASAPSVQVDVDPLEQIKSLGELRDAGLLALEDSTSTVCRSVLTPPGPGGHPSVGGS